jgi:pre-mRNA-splicing factor ISY1
MARNAEKAMTALARWRRMKEQEERGPFARRPQDTHDCNRVGDAERFRREILADISKKISQIQNPGLGEYKLRDLNDEINRMLKLKYAWECRIKELGGTDYRKIAPRELDSGGQEIYGNKGYKYFGAAKDLPGVRELFEQAAQEEPVEKKRGDLLRNVDAGYYGYLDDDDGLLVPLEKIEEERAFQRINKEWEEKGAVMNRWNDMDDEMYKVEDDSDDEFDIKESVVLGDDGKEMVIKHVMVPTQKEIEEMIIERKKQYLLDKFLG